MAIEKQINIVVSTKGDSELAGKLDKIKTGLKETTKESNNLNQTLQGSKQSEFINSIGDGVSKLNPAFGSAVKGANGLILKMWEMVANPVGAILAGIVVTAKFLYEAFQSSVAGGKELKTIFAGISAVGTQVKDAIFGLGRALINTATAAYKFITLDFKGAAEDMKKANKEASESYKQLGNAVDGTTFKIIKNLEKQQQANDKSRKIQAVVQSETNKLLVQSREILTDETASIKDKKKALEEVTKAEKSSSAEKVRIAKVDLDILKSKAAALGGEAEKKMKGEIREATIALNEAETENAMTGIKLNKQRKMLGRQELADAKEAAANLKEINAQKAADAKIIYDADKLALEDKLKQEGLSFAQRRVLVAENLLLNASDRKKLNDQINKEEQKSIDDHNKAIADLNKRYDDEKANRLADTAVKKEELDYQRKVLEIENLAQTETEKQTLIEKLNEEHLIRMGVAKKTDADKKEAEDKAAADKEIELAKRILEQKKSLQDAQINLASSAVGLLGAIAGKNKALQKASIVAENAIGIGKMFITTAASNVKATAEGAALSFSTGGASLGIAAALVASNNVSLGLNVASSLVATQKALAALGGGGGGAGGGNNSGAKGAPAPSFNLVQGTGSNQIAEGLATERRPVQAYVVASQMTTAQSLQRNIIDRATL
jgi:hypothetical protein